MATWAQFHTRVVPRVAGCPVPAVNAELRNAAAEFLRFTRAWRQWLAPFEAVEDQRSYDIVAPANTVVVRIEKATVDGKYFPIAGAFDLEADPAEHESSEGLSSSTRRTVNLGRALPAGAVIQLNVSLIPGNAATGVPDDIWEQYTDAIASGALSRLRSIKDKPFTDLKMAVNDRAFFDREMGRVQALVYSTHTATMPRRRPTWC